MKLRFAQQRFVKNFNVQFYENPTHGLVTDSLHTKGTPCTQGTTLQLPGSYIYIYIHTYIHTYIHIYGAAVAQWLRCCAKNRKVAVSIPAGVTGIFY